MDAIKDIKTIPDSKPGSTTKIIRSIINKMDIKDIKKLVKYAINYPARVRALLGAILEDIGYENIDKLKKSLNPLTSFKIGLKETDLASIKNWYIK